MSRKRFHLAVSLIAITPLLGCSRSNTPSAPIDATLSHEAVELDADYLVGPEEIRYVQCEEADADTVLVIHVTVPKAMEDQPFRIPLCRRRIRKLEYPFQSMGFAADGRSRQGFGIGYGGSIGVDSATDSTVRLSLSLYWTATDRTHGSFDERLLITIGEPSAKELSGNTTICWTFEDPTTKSYDGDRAAT